jgi:hypothetical protein
LKERRIFLKAVRKSPEGAVRDFSNSFSIQNPHSAIGAGGTDFNLL